MHISTRNKFALVGFVLGGLTLPAIKLPTCQRQHEDNNEITITLGSELVLEPMRLGDAWDYQTLNVYHFSGPGIEDKPPSLLYQAGPYRKCLRILDPQTRQLAQSFIMDGGQGWLIDHTKRTILPMSMNLTAKIVTNADDEFAGFEVGKEIEFFLKEGIDAQVCSYLGRKVLKYYIERGSLSVEFLASLPEKGKRPLPIKANVYEGGEFQHCLTYIDFEVQDFDESLFRPPSIEVDANWTVLPKFGTINLRGFEQP